MNGRVTRHFFLGLLTSAVGLGVSIGACDDTKSSGQLPGSTTASGMGGGSSTSSAEGGGGTDIVVPEPCEYRCSADLKSVVNCYGEVRETGGTCTAEQGCSPASGTPECIDDPCKAAEDSKSSYGCDYWALKTGLLDKAEGACFAAFVANTWSLPVQITVDYKGQELPIANHAWIPKGQGSGLTYEAYDAMTGLPPGQVAILFLARNKFGNVQDCPKPAAITMTETGVSGTGLGDAFHIKTTRPVVAYQILPYGGGVSAFTSATLLLPTSAWGTNYIGINAYKNSPLDPKATPLLNILAREDDTKVTILPKVDIQAGTGVEGSPANTVKSYTLKKGQFLQLAQPEELTGSPIQSSKPVGVWGGSSCMYVPSDKNACDSAQQQIPPVNALGNEYVAVRHRNRSSMEETPPWRLVGAVDNTVLTWSPAAPEGAPEKINSGEVFEFNSAGPFIVKSNDIVVDGKNEKAPFYLGGYMTGGETVSDIGDPEWVNVIPTEQYLNSYTLFTDPTYPETSLVVTRARGKVKAEDGTFPFGDVLIDCKGDKDIGGWIDIGDYQYTVLDLVKGNFQDVDGCSNGLHTMSSKQPFGVTVWGWGAIQGWYLVSYAYPAGAGVQPINNIVVPIVPK